LLTRHSKSAPFCLAFPHFTPVKAQTFAFAPTLTLTQPTLPKFPPDLGGEPTDEMSD
jgi:hypothetical protein